MAIYFNFMARYGGIWRTIYFIMVILTQTACKWGKSQKRFKEGDFKVIIVDCIGEFSD